MKLLDIKFELASVYKCSWIRIVCRVHITEDAGVDCKEAVNLIQGNSVDVLLTDWGYDTKETVDFAINVGMYVVIPPNHNRKILSEYNHNIYKDILLKMFFFT